jgi:hypothetical protein
MYLTDSPAAPPACDRRCSGCAFKKGAKANLEVTNRLTGMFAALGGIPFYCHDALGWYPDQPGYPQGARSIQMAADSLRSAPKLIHDSPDMVRVITDATPTGVPPAMFDADRAIIGRTPMCQGWKRAVHKLSDKGWFADPSRRVLFRQIAALGLSHIEELNGSAGGPNIRKAAIAGIGKTLEWFLRIQRETFGRRIDLEHK